MADKMIFFKNIQQKALVMILLLILGISQQAYGESMSCRCVAFRLDDIQDYYLNKVQMEVINTFQKKDADLTVGIIGNYFGNDQTLIKFMKERLKSNHSQIDVANHGWNHEDFTAFDKNGQSSLIKKTNEKILITLGVITDGFIPPFNMMNDDTLTALHENNIQYISANVTNDRPPYSINNNVFYHLPGTAFTGNLNEGNNNWLSVSNKVTFAQIQSSLIKYGFSVVMLHPQEYSIRQGLNYKNQVDFNQIHELELLIDEIRNNGLRIVTIKEIPEHTTHQKAPKWLDNIFAWHDAKKISTDEFINAISFLIEKKIIQTDLETQAIQIKNSLE